MLYSLIIRNSGDIIGFTAQAWLLVPALSMVGVAGTLILLTNLQVANLWPAHRALVTATLTAASTSGGLVIMLIKVRGHLPTFLVIINKLIRSII